MTFCKSGQNLKYGQNFGRSQIFARFWQEPERKSGTTLDGTLCSFIFLLLLNSFMTLMYCTQHPAHKNLGHCPYEKKENRGELAYAGHLENYH